MYKTEASAVSSASALLSVSDKGVLLAARKSSVAPNVKQQIICGVHEMDFDIPKVLTLRVTESQLYCPFGSKVVACKEIESAWKACAFIDKKEGMGHIRKVTLTGSRCGLHIWNDGCLDRQSFCEYWMKSGKGFVGRRIQTDTMTA